MVGFILIYKKLGMLPLETMIFMRMALILFLAMFVCVPLPAHAYTVDELTGRLQKVLDEKVSDSTVTPGASLCVILPNHEIVSLASGKNKRGKGGQSLTTSDNFRIASMTKTFIAAVSLMLEENSSLRLKSRARRYLKDVVDFDRVPNGKKVTVRHLLAMKSGIPDYLDTEGFDEVYSSNPHHRWTAKETIEMVYDLSPKFSPGQKFFYSNTNYTMMGKILSRVMHKRLSTLMRELLFDPLELSDTFVEFEASTRSLSTHGYEYDDNKRLKDVTDYNDGLGLGDGGIISTPSDVARFLLALFIDQTVLSEESLDKMTRFGAESDYGLGVERVMTDFGETWTHSGASSGFQGEYYYFPDSGLIWVLLTNSFETDLIEPVFSQTMPIILEYR